MDILTISILLIHEHGIFFHLCLFHILSSEFCSFQYRSFTFLVKFIPKYFIVFDIIVNGIIFFISFLDVLLLVYRCPTDSVCWFCIVQLYWIHWLVLTIFLVASLGFSTYQIISSAEKDNFASSFLSWMPFISFSCLIALARTSSTMLNKSEWESLSCSWL